MILLLPAALPLTHSLSFLPLVQLSPVLSTLKTLLSKFPCATAGPGHALGKGQRVGGGLGWGDGCPLIELMAHRRSKEDEGIGHERYSGDKEKEVPAKINVSPPSSPKKKRQKSEIVTTVLDPPPFLLPILEPSPLCKSSSEPKNPIQCITEEASPTDLNISSAGAQKDTVTGFYKPSPTIEEAQLAFDDLKRILRPPKKTAGYKDPELDAVFCRRLEGMKQFLWVYVDPQSSTFGKWTMTSLLTARALERKCAYS
ncbi:hypothetical protein EV702DRAFT_1043155 [Suillus placidus]|uniref:Uncharacterized protein n=1 Tax=Suillus placidus TaxID=48579 RepID=A0A9P7A0U9_9AGAM|nr:hypothetical protein EV702DRAFT_1043155 [Suillus placidus]